MNVVRLAIRARIDGAWLYLTDDGEGCDDSQDFTPRDLYPLVTYTTSEQARADERAAHLSAYRPGRRAEVVRVFE